MKQNQLGRRNFLKTAAALGAMTMVSNCIAMPKSKSSERPNILFCLADDWGWPHAGAYGDKVVKTPSFDRLANEGVLFEHAYVSSPSCTPCRNSILTGQQFYRLGQGANLHSTLDVKYPNFMFMLRDQGYQIGHWRKAWGPGKYKKGGYSEHPCGPNSDFTSFMKKRDKDKPFCFWLGTRDPHRGYKKGSGAKSGIDVDKVHVPHFFPNTKKVRSDIADYYFEVQRWDRDVGNAIRLLEQNGELDNTIVVMTGDHGMPFPRCKGNLYDWGVHVPLAIRWGAKAKPDSVANEFVSFTDLAPTFLAAAGVEVPAEMTGNSLLPLLEQNSKRGSFEEGEFVVFGRERHTPAQKIPSLSGYPARGIRTGRWLLIFNLEPHRWPAGVPENATHPTQVHADCDNGPTKSFLINHKDDPEIGKYYDLCFAKRPPVELYDCRKDPNQINNLADNPEFADVRKKLEKKLSEHLEKTDDPRFSDEPVKFDKYPYRAGYLKKRLKKAGYQ